MDELTNFILSLGKDHPQILAALAAIGALRISMKPAWTLIHKAVDKSSATWDNELLAKIEGNRLFKAAAYLLDWIASVKLTGPNAEVPPQTTEGAK